MQKQTWAVALAAGILALGGCGPTSDVQQQTASPATNEAKAQAPVSNHTNELTKISLSADSWIGKPGNELFNGLTIADAKDVIKTINSLDDAKSALASLKYQIPKSSFSPVVYKDRFSTIHAMGCRDTACGSPRSISWIIEYWYDKSNNISEVYICTDDGIEINIWSSYGNDIFEDGDFELVKPTECYEEMFFKGG
jgi:hypothetical protein